ncbi:hypothetical protein [Streptomyces sp. CB01373]|uniref:hypothetical protein n=1 Tax=Streptomyces sp. CB01373 TaxID=2020325 RepID=UPI0018FEF884|nr:hypothetical protein [Streptomyces sp. CB01373]
MRAAARFAHWLSLNRRPLPTDEQVRTEMQTELGESVDYRRSRWPNTADPHLLITRRHRREDRHPLRGLGAGTAGTDSRALTTQSGKELGPG